MPSDMDSRGLPDLECSICAQRGHGLHFGVVTCRACASFFSRSIIQKRAYKCLRGGNKCDIKLEGARKACRACRSKHASESGCESRRMEAKKGNNTTTAAAVVVSTTSPNIALYDGLTGVSDENAPNLAKFMRGYQAFIANQRTAFIVKHPESIFQNIVMVEATKDDLIQAGSNAKPLLFTMLNEHVEPFGQMPHENKLQLFDAAFEQVNSLHRNFLSALHFPEANDPRVMFALGYMVDTSQYFQKYTPPWMEPEEYARIKKPIFENFLAAIRRFKSVDGIKVQDYCALIIIVLWNEAEQRDLLNDEMGQHKEAILGEWLENLSERFGGNMLGASKFMARLLCLLVELKAIVIKQQETMTIIDIFQPGICPKE